MNPGSLGEYLPSIQVIKLVEATSGVERTRSLSLAYAEKARRVLNLLPASDTRLALESLTAIVVKPSW